MHGLSLLCAVAWCCATSGAGAAAGAAAPLLLQAAAAAAPESDNAEAAAWPLQKGMHFLGKSFEGSYGQRISTQPPRIHTDYPHPALTR